VSVAITAGRAEAVAVRSTFLALAARELRRFVVNPIFLFAVAMTVWSRWATADPPLEINAVNFYAAFFLGGFGMMATYGLTRSMRASEPVVGVAPTALPVRTAALCTVAILPFLCGWLALVQFLQVHPLGSPMYGAFSTPTQVAILIEQIVVPSLGGPLLGIALGRWVRFPGAAFVLLLLIFGWVNLVTFPSLSHPDSAPLVALRLFSPYGFFSFANYGVHVTTLPGSPWFFIGWQLALCAIAALVALLRGAEGRVRSRITRALLIVLVVAAIMFVLANVAGVSTIGTA
jgi:hypothetical protein